MPTVEKEQLQTLAQSASAEIILSILEAFWQSNDALFAALKDNIAAHTLDEAAKSAHGLKGSAANLGATAISEIARQLEIACKDGAAANARELLEKLPPLFEQTQSEMTALVETF